MKREPKHTSAKAQNIQENSKKKSSKKGSRKFLVPIIIGAVIVVIAALIIIILNIRSLSVNKGAYNLSQEALAEAANNKDVTNVVFLGIDKEENRSDVMMVISVNSKLKTVNVISLLRDTRVEIEGHAPTKLGYAYKWGGAELALKTINTNFNTAFDRFICMTFEDYAKIIDSIGGVDIELTEEEAGIVNDYAQVTGYYGWDAASGWNTLNGSQAVAYARIRNIDSEYARAGRQQVVVNAMLSKIKSMSVFQYPSIISEVLECLETNLSYGELLKLASSGIGNISMTSHTIPDANYEEGLFGGWVLNPDGGPEEDPVQWLWVYDLASASERLRKIMYDPDYYEDPNLPPKAWIWNELEDVIGEDSDIDLSEVDMDDEIYYVPAEDYYYEEPVQYEETYEEVSEESSEQETVTEATEQAASETVQEEPVSSEETKETESSEEQTEPEPEEIPESESFEDVTDDTPHAE